MIDGKHETSPVQLYRDSPTCSSPICCRYFADMRVEALRGLRALLERLLLAAHLGVRGRSGQGSRFASHRAPGP